VAGWSFAKTCSTRVMATWLSTATSILCEATRSGPNRGSVGIRSPAWTAVEAAMRSRSAVVSVRIGNLQFGGGLNGRDPGRFRGDLYFQPGRRGIRRSEDQEIRPLEGLPRHPPSYVRRRPGRGPSLGVE